MANSVCYLLSRRALKSYDAEVHALSNMNSYVTIEIRNSLVLLVATTALKICKYAMVAFNSKCKYEK